MLVICALALVVAAAAFLVMGLAGGEIGDLYLSMVLCVSSLVVVAVSARLSRIRPAPAASEPPAPVDPLGAAEAEPVTGTDTVLETEPAAGTAPVPRPEPVTQATPVAAEVRPTEDVVRASSEDEAAIWSAAPTSVAVAERPEPEREVQVRPLVEPEVEPFPIADYDALAVEQILPLVPRLWPEEVPMVADRERATKARPAVLDALAERAGDPGLAFPIAEYESLDTAQVTGLLDGLDDADLATVQAAERSGPARVGVLVAVANQLAARK